MIRCRLYKILLEIASIEAINEAIFWGYHLNEGHARDAAIRWGESNNPNSNITILKVDFIN